MGVGLEELPNELILIVISYLDLRSYLSLQQVSRRIRIFCRSKSVRKLFQWNMVTILDNIVKDDHRILYYPHSELFAALEGLEEDVFDLKDYNTEQVELFPGGEDRINISKYQPSGIGTEYTVEAQHWRHRLPHRVQTFIHIPGKLKILWIFQVSEYSQITEEDMYFSLDFSNCFMLLQLNSPDVIDHFIEKFTDVFHYLPTFQPFEESKFHNIDPITDQMMQIYSLHPITSWIKGFPDFLRHWDNNNNTSCIIFAANGSTTYSIEERIALDETIEESNLENLLIKLKEHLPAHEHRLCVFPVNLLPYEQGNQFLKQINRAMVFLRWKEYSKALQHYKQLCSVAIGYTSILIQSLEQCNSSYILEQLHQNKCMK